MTARFFNLNSVLKMREKNLLESVVYECGVSWTDGMKMTEEEMRQRLLEARHAENGRIIKSQKGGDM